MGGLVGSRLAAAPMLGRKSGGSFSLSLSLSLSHSLSRRSSPSGFSLTLSSLFSLGLVLELAFGRGCVKGTKPATCYSGLSTNFDT